MAQAVTGYTRDVIAGALSAEFSVDLVETEGRATPPTSLETRPGAAWTWSSP